jgi:DNA-binding transcriptional MerR regulator
LDKSPDAFRTISEAAEELDLPQHVLRFWETRFTNIKPLKRGGGRRYYRPEDVLLLKGIRHLLYDRGFTIKGVQKILKDQGLRYVIGIGEGRPVEALNVSPEPEVAEPVDADAAGADEAAPGMPAALMPPARSAPGRAPRLRPDDRERLNAVLRELLDCKRLLDRAREG